MKIFKILNPLSHPDSELDPDPNPDSNPVPLTRGTDPGIWIRIRTKMSRIPNTGVSSTYVGIWPIQGISVFS
jgi:hypothetical protein